MNAILSIIVCIAMLAAPAGVLPAQPETAATYTVRNLTIGIGDESVTLAPEARITTAVGTEKAALHFEIGSGEDALMPMSGELTADGLKFSIGNEEHCYSVSNDTFMEVSGMTAEDAAILNGVGDFMLGYGKLLTTAMDPAFTEEYQDVSWQLLAEMFGAEPIETTVELDGVEMPAMQLQGDIVGVEMLGVMDAMMHCGIPEMEVFVADCLELINLMLGEPVESFGALETMIGSELDGMSFAMDMTYLEDGSYARTEMVINDGTMEMTMSCEAAERDGAGTMVMVMDAIGPGNSMTYNIDMQYTGSVYAPTTMNLVYDIVNETGYSYEVGEGEEAYTYSASNSTAIHMEASSAVDENGLESGTASMTSEATSAASYDDGIETFTTTSVMDVEYSERKEEDGSITGSYAMAIAVEDSLPEGLAFNLSFDLNRSEGAYVDYFEGAEEYEITADFNEESPGYSMLMADVLALSADAVALTADDSVMELVTMFENMIYGEIEDEYALKDVDSLEAAAEVYGGEIPAYTAPAGYELDQITANEYTMNLVYASAEDSFELVLASYGATNSTRRYIIGEAGMEPVDGPLVEMETDADGRVDYVTIAGTDGLVFFYFNGVDEASALEIISGLEL